MLAVGSVAGAVSGQVFEMAQDMNVRIVTLDSTWIIPHHHQTSALTSLEGVSRADQGKNETTPQRNSGKTVWCTAGRPHILMGDDQVEENGRPACAHMDYWDMV